MAAPAPIVNIARTNCRRCGQHSLPGTDGDDIRWQARAEAEDALDAAWLDEADRIRRDVAREYAGSDPLERNRAVLRAKLPPRPAGFTAATGAAESLNTALRTTRTFAEDATAGRNASARTLPASSVVGGPQHPSQELE